MMQCTVCHKPYIGPKNHYVCTYCGASIESPVDLKKDPDHLRDVLRKGSEDGIWGYRDFFTVPEDAQPVTMGEGRKRETLLCHARWPSPDFEDAAAAAETNWLIDLVTAIRSTRAEMNVPPAATAMPPWRAITALAAAARSAGSRPNTTRLWLSWETVVARAPRQRPQPHSTPSTGTAGARP